MSKRSLILFISAIVLVVAAFASLFFEKNQVQKEYDDLLNGRDKEPANEPGTEPSTEPANEPGTPEI